MPPVNCVDCKKDKVIYGFEGYYATKCGNCKEDGMMNIKDVPKDTCYECRNLTATFGFEELRPTRCSHCKEDGMIDVRHKLCEGCGKFSALFNFEGKPPKYCGRCKEDNMINVSDKSKMCPHCVNWIDPYRGNKKYDGYCTRCFQQLFPTDPRTLKIRLKTKEIAVRNYINRNFDIVFKHDKPIWYGIKCPCKRRIDHRTLINNTLLCIETDPDQHRRYPKEEEEIRYNDLFAQFSGKFILIRFNTDAYKDSTGKKTNEPPLEERFEPLKQEIIKHIHRIEMDKNTELFEIHYMYYDED